ncbi:MAG: acetolactate synthase [Chloroflexi bacterium]|nr:thiamine pyrophosphate-binding protein [Chloroflexota bacterium]MXV94025.1 acetolactate synthase [Chloroflexota bacterium]MXX50138.1 acetolactate synthase [Chloroflexota bacterium]MXX82769.1 acetolactate synthase [Chloroflexota bacterium]MYC55250.1 acetolactate synthase [Chloroflexota bacterium]
MPQKTGGEAIVDSLIAHGIHTLYGLPGVQNDWLYNALFDQREQIHVIHTRHEEGAAYMAFGAAAATGEPAVFNVVPGPGLLNASAGLASAYAVNAPVLCIAGQVHSARIGRGLGDLHEIPHQSEVLRGLTKWSELVWHPAEAGQKLARAFQELRSGRPRPVGLEIPPDVLKLRAEAPPTPSPLPPYAPPVDAGAIESAARLLGKSQRPMICVGSGALGVSAEVTQLAEMLQAPVFAYRTGNGVLDSRHPLSLKSPEAHGYYRNIDLLLGIGSNMRLPLQRWGTDANMSIIRIDVDSAAMPRIQRPDLAITARAEDALPPLIAALDRHNRKRASRRDEMLALRATFAKRMAFLEPQNTYARILREELGEDGIAIMGMTQVAYAARVNFPVYKPRTCISSGYQGTLGFAFPTGLGAKVARPDVPVVAICGDGGFMYCAGELATAVQHGIPLVTIVFNNDAYGNVRKMQIRDYDERVIASELVNPDFVKLGQAFGTDAFRAETENQLREALRYGFKSDLPTLIEVPMGDTPSFDSFYDQGRVRAPQHG